MRKFSYLVGTAFLWLGGFAGAADLEVELPARYSALLDSYCLDCHDADTQKGKVNLEALSFHITTIKQAELWQKVLNALNAGENGLGTQEDGNFLLVLGRECCRRAEIIVTVHRNGLGTLVERGNTGFFTLDAVRLGIRENRHDRLAEQAALGIPIVNGDQRGVG